MGILGSGSVHMSGRYAKKPVTGRLGAVNAVCQKCLQKGHWTYDCKATSSLYQSRPSRTKQLMDPNYKPRFLGASELLPGDAKKGKEAEAAAKVDKKKRKKPASSSENSGSSNSDDSSSSSDDSSTSSDDSSSSSDSSSSDSSSDSDSSSSDSESSSSDSDDSNDSSSSDDASSGSASDSPLPKKKSKAAPAPAKEEAAGPREVMQRGEKPRSAHWEREHVGRSSGAVEGNCHKGDVREDANGGSHDRGHQIKQETRRPKIRSRVIAPE